MVIRAMSFMCHLLRGERIFPLRVVLVLLVFPVVFLLLPVVLDVSALAATYYVAGDTGSDSNPGTADEPWETTQKAADTMVAGDTVNVKGGVGYDETVTPANSGSDGNNIVYQSWAGTGIPTINGASNGFYLNAKDYITISGFYFNNESSSCIYLYNGSDNNIIKNNIFHNNGSFLEFGVRVQSSSDIKIYNNGFYAVWTGILIAGGNNVDIKDNIMSSTTEYGIRVISSTNVTIDYNLLYNNANSYTGCSAGEHDLSVDPLFVDPDNGDFRLQPLSPAIDAGTTLSGVTTDILGITRPQLGAYDIGAYEYVDETAPELTLDPFTTPTSDTTPAFSGTAVEVNGTVTAVQYQVDSTSGTWVACAASDGAFDEGSEPFTSAVGTELADGDHTIYVRASDSNGNTTAPGSCASITFMVDTTPPGFPVESTGSVVNIQPGSTVMVDTPRPEFVGITEPYAHVVIQIYSDVIIGETDADAYGNWSWTPGEDIPAGNHRVEVTVTDLAGNTAEYSYTLEIAGLADTGLGVLPFLMFGLIITSVNTILPARRFCIFVYSITNKIPS